MNDRTNAQQAEMELSDEQLEQLQGGLFSPVEALKNAGIYIARKAVKRFATPSPPPNLTYVSVIKGGIYDGRKVYTLPNGRFVVK